MKADLKPLILSIFILMSCSGCAIKPREPDAARLNAELGFNYLKQRDIVRAKEHFIKALSEDDQSAMILDAYAYYCETVQRNQCAVSFYQKAIEKWPNSGMVYNNYGTYLCRHGEYKKSIDYFLKAIKIKNYLYVGSAYQNASDCAKLMGNTSLSKFYKRKMESYE